MIISVRTVEDIWKELFVVEGEISWHVKFLIRHIGWMFCNKAIYVYITEILYKSNIC